MRSVVTILILIVVLSCSSEKKENAKETVFPEEKTTIIDSIKNLIYGSSYLAVYSDIYDLTEESTHLLTATISIRNTNGKDSIFITRADYLNTKGEMVRSYIHNPVYLTPLETIEIIIPRRDTTGGSGAKFIFEWAIPDERYEPLFESVMIWVTGNQGISFTSKGINSRN